MHVYFGENFSFDVFFCFEKKTVKKYSTELFYIWDLFFKKRRYNFRCSTDTGLCISKSFYL